MLDDHTILSNAIIVKAAIFRQKVQNSYKKRNAPQTWFETSMMLSHSLVLIAISLTRLAADDVIEAVTELCQKTTCDGADEEDPQHDDQDVRECVGELGAVGGATVVINFIPDREDIIGSSNWKSKEFKINKRLTENEWYPKIIMPHRIDTGMAH